MIYEKKYFAIDDKMLLAYQMAIASTVTCDVYTYRDGDDDGETKDDLFKNWWDIRFKGDNIDRNMKLSDPKYDPRTSCVLQEFINMKPDYQYVSCYLYMNEGACCCCFGSDKAFAA